MKKEKSIYSIKQIKGHARANKTERQMKKKITKKMKLHDNTSILFWHDKSTSFFHIKLFVEKHYYKQKFN